jgi:hypothetical protein
MPIRSACEAAGISHPTYKRWIAAAEAAEDAWNDEHPGEEMPAPKRGSERAFRAAVMEAKSDAHQRLVDGIAAAAAEPRHWKAGAWLLERRHADEYRVTPRVAVEHSGTVAVAVDDDELVAFLLSRAGSDDDGDSG